MKKIHELIIFLAILTLNIPGATAQNLFVISNENTPGSEFDTLVMEDTGNTTLYGTFTLSDGTSPYTLPNTDGASGQVLATDGSGAVSWTDGGGEFTRTGSVVHNSTDTTNDDFVFGSTQLDDTGTGNEDARMFLIRARGLSVQDQSMEHIGMIQIRDFIPRQWE